VVVPDDKGNIFTGELLSRAVKCLPFFQGKKVMTAASLSGCLSVEFLLRNLPNLECYNHRTQGEPIYVRKLKIPFHPKNKLFRVNLSLNGN